MTKPSAKVAEAMSFGIDRETAEILERLAAQGKRALFEQTVRGVKARARKSANLADIAPTPAPVDPAVEIERLCQIAGLDPAPYQGMSVDLARWRILNDRAKADEAIGEIDHQHPDEAPQPGTLAHRIATMPLTKTMKAALSAARDAMWKSAHEQQPTNG
jgi:hypothetical protein